MGSVIKATHLNTKMSFKTPLGEDKSTAPWISHHCPVQQSVHSCRPQSYSEDCTASPDCGDSEKRNIGCRHVLTHFLKRLRDGHCVANVPNPFLEAL